MKKRVLIRQKDHSDCGPACLASVAANYNLQLPVSRIRQWAGTDRSGSTMSGLMDAAAKIGFRSRAVRISADQIRLIPLPAIAHLNVENKLRHFVVLYKVSGKAILLMDPSEGKWVRKGIVQFQKEWTGILMLLSPGDQFQPGSGKLSTGHRFWKWIRPHRHRMLQAFAGAAIYTLLGLSFSIYVQKIFDVVLLEEDFHLLNLLSSILVTILIFQWAIGSVRSFIGLHTGLQVDACLIMEYYRHLLSLPQIFFDRMRVGELISRVNDAVKIRVFINDIMLNIVLNGFTVIFSSIFLLILDWKLAFITMGAIPAWGFIFWLNNLVNKKWQRRLMENNAEFESQWIESIQRTHTIKIFSLEGSAMQYTETKFLKLLNSIARAGSLQVHFQNGYEFLNRLLILLVLWAGSYFVLQRELSPGQLFSFYTVTGYFTGALASLIATNKNIQEAFIAADRLFEIMDLESEKSLQPQVQLSQPLAGDICFSNISFFYSSGQNLFNGLNLHIRANSMTAIIGETGSGKSTLFSLLQNLYTPKAGEIRIGEMDIRMIQPQSLHRLIASVPQQIDIFTGTLIENIALGDDQPDLYKIRHLTKMLGFDEFLENLPAGYYTTLTPNGTNLSGGQKQKLAIARALYRDPQILLLDEPTAALDQESEKKVLDALAWFRSRNRTLVIIAHRLSTIRACDDIVILKQGRIIQQGSPNELAARDGYYRDRLRAFDHQRDRAEND